MCIRDSKERYADKQPYGEWIDRYMVNLKDLKIPNQRVPEYTKAVSYTHLDVYKRQESTVALFLKRKRQQ